MIGIAIVVGLVSSWTGLLVSFSQNLPPGPVDHPHRRRVLYRLDAVRPRWRLAAPPVPARSISKPDGDPSNRSKTMLDRRNFITSGIARLPLARGAGAARRSQGRAESPGGRHASRSSAISSREVGGDRVDSSVLVGPTATPTSMPPPPADAKRSRRPARRAERAGLRRLDRPPDQGLGHEGRASSSPRAASSRSRRRAGTATATATAMPTRTTPTPGSTSPTRRSTWPTSATG